MPTNKELLESLRNDFVGLELFDRARLRGLQGRGQMLIGRVFGEGSPYSEMLSGVEFRFMGISIGTLEGGDSPATRRAQERAWLSGQEESIALIDTMLEDLELGESEQVQDEEAPPVSQAGRVFVVHGHDDVMKESVARVLTSLGLQPVILHEQPDQGQTIIEKIERHSNVGFAVVLLSPDDIGYRDADGPDAARPRARQNVVMELGYFAGKLGRQRVVALHRGDIELPSDYEGVLYTAIRKRRCVAV